MTLRVSALVTNYNYGRYLRRAVESALNQTRPVAEVVVVDDGSTDDSREVLEQLAAEHPGRVVVVTQDNAGQEAAAGTGFPRTTGEVVCMLDADDLWCERKVERVAAAFEADPEVVMVGHGYRTVDAGGFERPGRFTGGTAGDLAGLMVGTGGAWVFGATSSLSFRRNALQRILPVPRRRWQNCLDGALAYPASFLGKCDFVYETLSAYRVHGENNFAGLGHDPSRVQADVEATVGYLNDFLARLGRPERVNLMRNLHYRRDRFYREGGGLREAAAVARLIVGWPLYSPGQRAKFLTRFLAKAALGRGRSR